MRGKKREYTLTEKDIAAQCLKIGELTSELRNYFEFGPDKLWRKIYKHIKEAKPDDCALIDWPEGWPDVEIANGGFSITTKGPPYVLGWALEPPEFVMIDIEVDFHSRNDGCEFPRRYTVRIPVAVIQNPPLFDGWIAAEQEKKRARNKEDSLATLRKLLAKYPEFREKISPHL